MPILVILIIGATCMGISASVRDPVNERPICARERAVGLAPEGYLLSKLLIFGGLVVVQTATLLLFVALSKPLAESALVLGGGTLELFVVCAATAFTSACPGLLISSLVGTSEQVMPLLVVSVMTQLVLCGRLIPVAGRAVLEKLAFLAPAQWEYAGAASSVSVGEFAARTDPNRLWDQ